MASYWQCRHCNHLVDSSESTTNCTECKTERKLITRTQVVQHPHTYTVVGKDPKGREIKVVQMPASDLKAGKFDGQRKANV